MAEKRFDTRILLKYDSLSNWNSSSLVLKAGEVAIATVPATEAVAKNTDGVITPPAAVVFKVGDGEHTFKDLPLTSSLAADVYGWAKKDESEFISWLEDKNKFALKTGFDNLSAEVSAIDAAYKKADKELSDLIDSITGGTGDVEGLGALSARITDLETVLTSFIGEDENGNVTTDAVKAAIDAVANKVSTLEGKVATLEADKAAKDTKIANLEAADTAMDTRVGAAEGKITALEEKVGDVTNIKQAIADAESAAKSHADNAVASVSATLASVSAKADAAESAIAVLNSEGEGSVKAQVAAGIAEVVADADADFDTLKEIADWILNDKEGAAALQNTVASHTTKLGEVDNSLAALSAKDNSIDSEIAAIKEDILALEGEGGVSGVVSRVDEVEDAIEDIEAAIGSVPEGKTLISLVDTNAGAISGLSTTVGEQATLIGNLDAAVKAEESRAKAKEDEIIGLLNAEVTRATAAEGANKTLIETLDAEVKALHKVAKSGLIEDLSQAKEVIFDCGNSAERVYEE
ncbi:MAG: hypothetical protein IKW21_05940, partial [Lachnospiraceae bacterium]|nr:hypothetical protein [Lachnospiraceae bacterium]